MNELLSSTRSLAYDPVRFDALAFVEPGAAISDKSKEIAQKPRELQERSTGYEPALDKSKAASLEERLYDALSGFKIHTSKVAMHLDDEWRHGCSGSSTIFWTLPTWKSADVPPSLSSFATFLRMVLVLKPAKRPGLSATSDGNLIASWTSKDHRLTSGVLCR